MRYFVHCDNSFRKAHTISSKLKCLDTEITEEEQCVNTVTYLYGYTYPIINSAFSKLNVIQHRRYSSEINKCLNYTDCVILFHNFIEYDNGMQSLIDTCLENNIPIVVFSNHVKKGFLVGDSNELIVSNKFPELHKSNNCVTMKDFHYKPYKFSCNLTFNEVTNLTRQTYQEINKEKEERSIKFTTCP